MLYGLVTSTSLFGLAILTSLIEIEIDPYGWTTLQNTTWHRSSNVIAQIMGKPVTGYHLYFAIQQVFMLFLGLVTLYPYIENADGLFLLFASYFPIWNVVEDFGWFVLNPYFGVENFHKNKIWWHHNNCFINDRIPIMYLNAFGISMVLGFLSGHFVQWLQFVSYSGLLMYGVVQVAPEYHKHYMQMRWSNYEERKPQFEEMFSKGEMYKLAKKLEYYEIFKRIREDDKKLALDLM